MVSMGDCGLEDVHGLRDARIRVVLAEVRGQFLV